MMFEKYDHNFSLKTIINNVEFSSFHFTATYMPLTKRFFLHSYTGLWRVCRYALVPVALSSTALPRTFAELALTNRSELDSLRSQIAEEPYIKDYLNAIQEPFESIIVADDSFKRALFANWIRNTTDFPRLKMQFKGSRPDAKTQMFGARAITLSTATAAGAPTLDSPLESLGLGGSSGGNGGGGSDNGVGGSGNGNSDSSSTLEQTINSNTTIAATIATVTLQNSTALKIVVPEALRRVLYDGWEQQPNIVPLMALYANAMDISTAMTDVNGRKLVIRPPTPTQDGKQRDDYKYVPWGNVYYHIFIQIIILCTIHTYFSICDGMLRNIRIFLFILICTFYDDFDPYYHFYRFRRSVISYRFSSHINVIIIILFTNDSPNAHNLHHCRLSIS